MFIVRMGSDNDKQRFCLLKYSKQYQQLFGILLDNAWIVL